MLPKGNCSGSIAYLRDAASRIGDIGTTVHSEFLKATADIYQQSNQFVELAQLPREIISCVFARYADKDLNADEYLRFDRKMSSTGSDWTKLTAM